MVNIGMLSTFVSFINNPKTIYINILFLPVVLIHIHVVEILITNTINDTILFYNILLSLFISIKFKRPKTQKNIFSYTIRI